MIERYLHALYLEAPGAEATAATRERLRDAFPRGATRRMTQLGLLVGNVLGRTGPTEDDTLVYASTYAESRALEDYLVSFPTPSPTLFQTSIHPSAVQQALIARQQPIKYFFPHTGQRQLVVHAVQTALLAPTPRVVLCGGEERGSWLRQHGAASEETFAFAFALSGESNGALGRLALQASDEGVESPPLQPGIGQDPLTLSEFFSALLQRRPLDQIAAPGLRLTLAWQ